MRLRASLLLFALPLLAACSAESEPTGTAEEAIKVCPGATTLQGVDVSHYDGTIDWAKAKASGRVFAVVKATEGTGYTDPMFAGNWAAMKQNGVVRSAYHFFHANMDPVAQANHFLSVMGKLQPGDLPPTLDLEVTDSQSAATITSTATQWLDTIAAATGTKPILYTSPSFVSSTLGSPAGLQNHAQLWIANWQVTCPDVPAPFTTWPFWQYSSTGTVPGIPGSSGGTDLDEFNGDMAALTALTVPASSSSSSSSSTASSSSGSSSSTVSGSSSGSTGAGTGGGSGTSSGGTGASTGSGRPGGTPSLSGTCSAAPAGGAAGKGWLLAVAALVATGLFRRRRSDRGYDPARRRYDPVRRSSRPAAGGTIPRGEVTSP
jgi:MYXO-CTERM domain-containing protein